MEFYRITRLLMSHSPTNIKFRVFFQWVEIFNEIGLDFFFYETGRIEKK
jgi:hypothetical protein